MQDPAAQADGPAHPIAGAPAPTPAATLTPQGIRLQPIGPGQWIVLDAPHLSLGHWGHVWGAFLHDRCIEFRFQRQATDQLASWAGAGAALQQRVGGQP